MLTKAIMWWPSRQFKRATSLKIKTLEETLSKLEEEKARATKHSATTLVFLHNASLYLLLLDLDHTTLIHDFVSHKNTLRQTVYAKHLISLFSEFFDDFPEIYGKKIREIIEKLPNSSNHISTINKLSKDIRAFRKHHAKDFHRIRNAVGAHRDLDGELQLRTLREIDSERIQKLSEDFILWLNKMYNFISTVTLDYSKSFQMVQEICQKIKQTN